MVFSIEVACCIEKDTDMKSRAFFFLYLIINIGVLYQMFDNIFTLTGQHVDDRNLYHGVTGGL